MDNNQIIQKKYCLYARKSSEEDERQALSIDSQIKEMMQIAEKECLEIVDIKKESHSAKESSKRDVFNSIISDLKDKKFNSILTWNTDRLSRNAGDLGSLIDLVDKNLLVEIKIYNQVFKNTPNDKFMLMIFPVLEDNTVKYFVFGDGSENKNYIKDLESGNEEFLYDDDAPIVIYKSKQKNKLD